ncbi:MAG TPA: hypothetical protein VGL39_10080 [Jatrophihabitantaceae bacterium]
MSPIPTPVRAALGLVVNAVEAARTLPDRAVELPVLAVSTALQFSLRAQQRYAELTLRGDELLGRLHGPPEDPPSWATFDDEGGVGAQSTAAGGLPPSLDDLPASLDDLPASLDDSPVDGAPPADIPLSSPAPVAPAVKSATKQPRARKAPAKKTTAAAKATGSTAKPVRAPRQAKPSAFDRTDDHE